MEVIKFCYKDIESCAECPYLETNNVSRILETGELYHCFIDGEDRSTIYDEPINCPYTEKYHETILRQITNVLNK